MVIVSTEVDVKRADRPTTSLINSLRFTQTLQQQEFSLPPIKSDFPSVFLKVLVRRDVVAVRITPGQTYLLH